MPRLEEYQGKRLLSDFGIRVPQGGTATSAEEARDIAGRIGGAVVIKAQVGTTGRMSFGGVQFADGPDNAATVADEILHKEVRGLRVTRVLVEQRIPVDREYYASIIVNDSHHIKGPVLMISNAGGSGIEEVAVASPDRVRTLTVNILDGLSEELVRCAFVDMGEDADVAAGLSESVGRLYQLFRHYGARSSEINPLILGKDGLIYALDCRIVLDEGAVARHPELGIDYPRDLGREPTALERVAWEVEKEDFRGTGYFVQMALDCKHGDRCIGFMGLGGGGAMLSADALITQGLKLADYADTSGNPPASKVYRITKIILAQPNIDGCAIMGPNIANQEQMAHCARPVCWAFREELPCRPGFPVVVFMAGNKEAESLEILREGLKDMPARVEVFGREYITRVDQVARRMREMVDEYAQQRDTQNG